MTKLYQSFTVTGVANTTTYDSGITSTDSEHKTVDSVIVSTSGQIGNKIQVWLEREKKAEVFDYNLDTIEASGTATYKSTSKLLQIPLGIDVPVGQTLKVAIECGGTLKTIYGSYVYQII